MISLANSLLAGARSLGRPDPRLVVYAPVARGNPFQELVYGRLRERGVAPVPGSLWHELDAVRSTLAVGIPTALHLHWTTQITGGAGTEHDASQAADRFLADLDTWRADGLRFVWTLHNRLPHECRFPRVETRLRQALAERADVVHVMSPDAEVDVRDLYVLPPDRVAHIPHPAYSTVYPSYAVAADVRLRLGIGPNDFVVSAVGAIQPYKNIASLARAVRVARERTRRRIWLIVAGAYPQPTPALDELIDELRCDSLAIVETRHLTDREVAEMLSAADLVSTCYDSPLVSGSAMLALTMGRPVLAVDAPRSRQLLDAAGLYATSTSSDDIADVLVDAAGLELTPAREAARAIAAEHDPAVIAGRMAELLDGVLSADVRSAR